MECYRGTGEVMVCIKYMGGRMLEDRPGFPTYLREFNTNPSRVLLNLQQW